MRRPGRGLCVCAALLFGLCAACGARTELLVDESSPQSDACVPVHREGGLDGCLQFCRYGDPGAAPSDRLEAFLADNGASVVRISDGPELTARALAACDIVIVESPTRLHSGTESRILFDYVKAGGGLMVTSGYRIDESDKAMTNSLIVAVGAVYVGHLLNGDVTQFDSPTLKGVKELPFLGGYVVGAVSANQPGDYGPVAWLNLRSVGAELTLGKGRAFFWGDDWIEFDQEWKGQNDTPRFWLDVMRWLAHQS